MKKQKIQYYIIGFFWIVFLQSMVAQSSYIFHHLNTNDGLSNSNVRSILKDKYGFLWVGTDSGLNRYDGYGFKVYTMQAGKPNTLGSNNIFNLQEDGLGNIWVDLGYAYTIYNRDKDNFISNIKQFLQDLGIQSEEGSKIYVDKKQNLWVLNKEKIFCYNVKKQHVFSYQLKEPLDYEPGYINISDDGEWLYFIDPSVKCWQLSLDTGIQTSIKSPKTIKRDIGNYTNKIYVDGSKGLWVYLSKSHELFYKGSENQEWKTIELKSEIKTISNTVTSFIENKPGQIWIGTDHEGLFVYDKMKDSLTNIVHYPFDNRSLSFNNIFCLYRDDNETIWIGHTKKGLSFYHESFKNFMNFEHPECTDVSTIMEDHLGNIWLGTDGNGLFVKKKKSNNVLTKLPISNTAIVSILEDKKNRIWIGTYQRGLFCYDNGKMVQYTTENSKLSNNDIWGLKEDRYGNIWIGTLGGRIHLLPSESEGFDSLLSPFDENVHALDMFYDGGDKIFIATVNGLWEIDITNHKKVVHYGNRKGTQQFKQLRFFNVYKDNRDILWIGHSGGLDIWDQKKDTIYSFNKAKGLCDNAVNGIIGDNLNNIWVTTTNGFSILTVERDFNGKLNITSKNYSVKDGLMDNYFNNHSISKLRNGDMLLGNKNGYTVVNPNKLAEKNRPMAKVVFTGLSIGNQNVQVDSIYNGHKVLEHPMEMTSNLTFKHSDRFISLNFTTGDLLNAEKVK
ncbi:MAG TPA: two-component regulator propeller domain-containing protein, partial [Flavobacteriaceae bacterium]|nr:two-component regulator propeller domain-containing protein [Flavobacteriaceae bacterium]